MANVTLALSTATSDTLRTVSRATGAIGNLADSVGYLAATASAHAEAYHDASVRDLALDAASRKERRLHEMAQSDGEFYKELHESLKSDATLKSYYEKSLANYRKALKKAKKPKKATT